MPLLSVFLESFIVIIQVIRHSGTDAPLHPDPNINQAPKEGSHNTVS